MGTVFLDRMDNRIDGVKEAWQADLDSGSPSIDAYETVKPISRRLSPASRSISLEDIASGTRINVADILGKHGQRIAISLNDTADTIDLYINPVAKNARPNETGPDQVVTLWPVDDSTGTCKRGIKVSISGVLEWISTEDLGENHIAIESIYVHNVSTSGSIDIIVF